MDILDIIYDFKFNLNCSVILLCYVYLCIIEYLRV